MSKPINHLKSFKGGGLDLDTNYEEIAPNDLLMAFNARNTGTGQNETNYISNPESTTPITVSQPTGINKGIGGGSFEDVRMLAYFRFNSFNNCQIVLYNMDTDTEQVVFEDITDTGGLQLLPLKPQNYVKAKLINETYMVWVTDGLTVGFTNLNKLISGAYGTFLAEDLSLLKPQCLIPPTGTYGSDLGQPANFFYGKLPQYLVYYVNDEFNYSACSTWSKRIVPYQQNTPTLGSNVTQNNYIIVSVNIGSIRVQTVNIGRRFGTDIWNTIKSVDRTYIVALPNTAVNVSTEIYEAYDPATNLYSFVDYANQIEIPIATTTTDLSYDYVPLSAGALEKINNNYIGLSDLEVGYPMPTTSVTIKAIGYDPNIDIPAGTYANPLTALGNFPGASGSGAGGHRRIMSITIGGVPQTGDTIVIITADIRNASATLNHSYTVPSSQSGNLAAVVASISATVTGSYVNNSGSYTITFTDLPYYGLQTYAIRLFFSGAAVANSIPTILDNTTIQYALSYRDGSPINVGGRFFPLVTGNSFIVPTPSYAQVNGNAVEVSVQINTATAPVGAIDYQILSTKPPINKLVETIATPLNYVSGWDAATNMPALSVNSGQVGDTYQITTPKGVGASGYVNLGNNQDYNTGDYLVYNGQYWGILPKSFGDLTATGNILAFSLNPLKLFNEAYATAGVSTILAYDFAVGDRCTLHYYLDAGGNKVFLNNPCVNLSVFGYDAGNYIVKMEKSATFDTSVLVGMNVFLRLYSLALASQTASTTQDGTVWYEIGQRYTITNGLHDTLNFTVFDGGAYYKTRQFPDGLLPYTNPPIQVLATDLNYSDFYPSEFSSFGRPRTINDELEQTERKAITITSQNYVLGSKINGLTRFFPENVYGEADGQTSSSFGAIQVMWQRGDVLVLIQELNIFYVPVNIAYQQLNDQLTGVAISEKLLNNGRYERKGIGIGRAKESFCYKDDVGYFVSPIRSEPFEITLAGVDSISGKMSKYFRATIADAFAHGYKIIMFYNMYYDEVMLCIETQGGIITSFPFASGTWQPDNSYVITGTDVSATPNGAHCTASYNPATGIVTYTPTTNYVGNDTATFTFTPPGGSPITLNNCLTWIAGTTTVNPFNFLAQTGVPLSTNIISNGIVVSGPNIAVAVSITGGMYSKNGAGYTNAVGTTVAGDTFTVLLASSGSYTTATSATLTIGATSGTFTVTTRALGNFSLLAQYGITITNLVAGSATGIPVFTFPITPGNNESVAYTAVVAGTVIISISGTPVFPNQQIDLYVGGGPAFSRTPITMATDYTINIPNATDPTTILFAIDQF